MRRWLAVAAAWLLAALLWSEASAASARQSPLATLPWGLLTMGTAALMGVAVWRLTARLVWNERSPAFFAIHAGALVLYSAIYATSWFWFDVARGRLDQAVASLVASPVLGWNLLMGSWLYLLVAGLSYAIRGQRRIRTQDAAAAEARLLAQQAQLAALRAQINPHFLFNALHSVGALVTSDPARADQALERLGDLLRYALDAGDEVTFAAEWRFTHDYLAFERLRLGDRLRVEADAEPAALSAFVPPLIFQPLVENAVRHGIANRVDGGRIALRARVDHGRVVLDVSDDGAGAGAEGASGLGLASIRQRLAARYGDRASLTIARGSGTFTVTVALPYVTATGVGSAA